jgi:uncharacterized protein with GYD domain
MPPTARAPPGSSIDGVWPASRGSRALACLRKRAGRRGGGWCARRGRVYDLQTAVVCRSAAVHPPAQAAARQRGLAGDLLACSRPGGNPMPLYMYQASYTAKSMADQLKEPQDPVAVIRPALEELGATIVVAGFPFGEYDVLVVYEAPDDMTAASVAMAVAAAGEVKSGKTTRLLSGQEWLESLRKRRIVTSRKRASPPG